MLRFVRKTEEGGEVVYAEIYNKDVLENRMAAADNEVR
jgi:hypothetical protein